ncbi:PQQ-binding-like beta-propeller repeat protein [Streptomyces sp. NPDC002688]|uniref:caspase, EACC1-associated type n=1 Tax=Streptomyces sp. NPDC002688 TaxID=3154423 RepID=UPI0033274D8A
MIVGIDAYTNPDLQPLPTAAAGAKRLAALLHDSSVWGLPPAHVTVLGAETSKEQILAAVRDAAKQATDTLLVYFAGHGLRNRTRDQLYLGLADADENHPQVGALSYLELRDVLRQAGHRARYRITVLDCCYSGMAGSMGTPAVPTRTELAHVLHEPATDQADNTDDYGDCVLTSAPPTMPSFAPRGAAFPEFTGELISVLDQGIEGAGPTLSLDETWQRIRRRLRERGSPLPQQFAQNTAARQIRFHNRAAASSPVSVGSTARTWRFPFELPSLASHSVAVVVAEGTVYLCNSALCAGLDTATGIPRWTYVISRELGSSHLAVADGTVYASVSDGTIRAIDTATGTEKWRSSKAGIWGGAWPIAAVSGAVYYSTPIGVGMGALRVLDAATGVERWRHRNPGLPPSKAEIAHGVVYYGTGGSVRALNAATGTKRWSQSVDKAALLSVAVSNGRVHATGNTHVAALDAATGSILWKRRIGGLCVATPVSADGLVYASNGKQVHVFDAATGTPHRTYLVGTHSPPAVADGRVFIRSTDLSVWDAATGAGLWTRGLGRGSEVPPIVSDGLVYVSSGDGYVYALDAAAGSGPQ